MLAHADDVTANLSLVRDYQRRPVMARTMSSLVDDVNYFANAVTAHTVNSRLVVPATAMLMHLLVMGTSPLVMAWSGTSAGVLLAALTAMQTMGRESEKLFDALIQLQLSVSALLRVSHCMNLQSDVPERMLANRKQRERGRRLADSQLEAWNSESEQADNTATAVVKVNDAGAADGSASNAPGCATHDAPRVRRPTVQLDPSSPSMLRDDTLAESADCADGTAFIPLHAARPPDTHSCRRPPALTSSALPKKGISLFGRRGGSKKQNESASLIVTSSAVSASSPSKIAAADLGFNADHSPPPPGRLGKLRRASIQVQSQASLLSGGPRQPPSLAAAPIAPSAPSVPVVSTDQRTPELASNDSTPSSVGAGPGTAVGEINSIRFAADEMRIELIGVGLSQLVMADDDVAINDASPAARRSGGSQGDSSPEPPRRLMHGAERGSIKINSSLIATLQRASSVSNGQLADAPEARPQHLMLRSPIQHVDLTLPQGRMYAVVGAHSSGKSTLLRLMGKAVHPTAGEVFVPPHLSIIHVENEPQIFRHMTLYENLTLGFKMGVTAPPITAICEVCERLGLAKRWIEHIKDEYRVAQRRLRREPQRPLRVKDAHQAAAHSEVGPDHSASGWQNLLSATDRRVIHLARALVTNPHVLVLHRPLAALDEDVAAKVLAALRQFISRRSLFSDSNPSNLLRRTVIFSSSTLDDNALEAADDIIYVGTPFGGATLLQEAHRATQIIATDAAEDVSGETSQSLPARRRHSLVREMEMERMASAGSSGFDERVLLEAAEEEDLQEPSVTLVPAANEGGDPERASMRQSRWSAVRGRDLGVRSAAGILARSRKAPTRRGSFDIQSLL